MSDSVTLHYSPYSEPCRSVLAYILLSNIPHSVNPIDLAKGEAMTPEFTQINPFQEVPAISHGSFNLNESAAIVTYLSEVFSIDNEWYPKDLKLRGRINAYLHWHHSNTREKGNELFLKSIVFPVFLGGEPLPAEEQARLQKQTQGVLSDIEWVLGETGYVARTERMTIADIFAFNEIDNYQYGGVHLTEGTKVKKWYDEVGSLEVVQNLRRENSELLSKFSKSVNS